jgi:hypothetical protein
MKLFLQSSVKHNMAVKGTRQGGVERVAGSTGAEGSGTDDYLLNSDVDSANIDGLHGV